MTEESERNSVKSAIMNIAYHWIGQSSDNSATKREEKLRRYHLAYSYKYSFYYQLYLWHGTSIGIYWPSHHVSEDLWDERPPIAQNAGGQHFVTSLTVSSIREPNYQGYLMTIFDNLNIFPANFQLHEIEFETLQELLNSLEEINQGLLI